MRTKLSSALLVLSFAFIGVPSIHAVSTPQFPSCANASGTVIASYPDGVHGIVGSTDTYTGSDTVYRLSESTVMQCFCGSNNVGIQTNWADASTYTEEDITALKAIGWHYVPDGSAWGLSAGPFIASNTTYSCKSGSDNNTGGGGGSNGGNSGGGSNDSGNSGNNIGGGDVSGLGSKLGDILGLADTGDSLLVYSMFLAALLFLSVGLFRLRNSHRS